MAQQRKRLKKLNTWYNKEKENNLTHGTTKKKIKQIKHMAQQRKR